MHHPRKICARVQPLEQILHCKVLRSPQLDQCKTESTKPLFSDTSTENLTSPLPYTSFETRNITILGSHVFTSQNTVFINHVQTPTRMTHVVLNIAHNPQTIHLIWKNETSTLDHTQVTTPSDVHAESKSIRTITSSEMQKSVLTPCTL